MNEWDTPAMRALRPRPPRGVYSRAEELLIRLYSMLSGNADFVEKRMIEDYFGGEGRVPEPAEPQA